MLVSGNVNEFVSGSAVLEQLYGEDLGFSLKKLKRVASRAAKPVARVTMRAAKPVARVTMRAAKPVARVTVQAAKPIVRQSIQAAKAAAPSAIRAAISTVPGGGAGLSLYNRLSAAKKTIVPMAARIQPAPTTQSASPQIKFIPKSQRVKPVRKPAPPPTQKFVPKEQRQKRQRVFTQAATQSRPAPQAAMPTPPQALPDTGESFFEKNKTMVLAGGGAILAGLVLVVVATKRK